MQRPGARGSSPQPQNETHDGKCRSSKRIGKKLNGSLLKFLKVDEESGSCEVEQSWTFTPPKTANSTQRNRHIVNNFIFKPALKVCWRQYSDQLKNSVEVLTLRNASALFNDADALPETRKLSALWSLAIPIVMQRGTLSNDGTLACRTANKEVKAAVDDALIIIQPTWMTNAYRFTTVDSIQSFLNHFDGTSGNPFISMQCHVRASDAACFERSLELFTKYGHYLHTLNFGMDITQPFSVLDQRLVQLLTLLPSVKSLSIGLRGFAPERDPAWMFGMIRREPMPALPALNSLTMLEVYIIADEICFPSGSLQDLMQGYGWRVTRFVCDHHLFNQMRRVPFVNLRHLELSHFNRSVPGYRSIFHIREFRLDSLYLSGNEIVYNPNTVLLLNRVKETLKELRMDYLRENTGLPQLDSEILQTFLKLKRLTLCTSLINNNGLWYAFRRQFVNLEYLRFESRDQARIPNEAVVTAAMWNRVFGYFHKLQTITWVVRRGELVFKRE